MTQAPFRTSQIIEHAQAGERSFAVLWVFLLCQTGALAIEVCSMSMAAGGAEAAAAWVSVLGFTLAFASAWWVLTGPRLTRALRNIAVVCLAVTMTVLHWMRDPLLFRQYDEHLHMRTLSDILSSHRLFQPHPQLGVSPRYPGMESVTALFHQLGLPVMVAAMTVVLLARLVLVSVLCDAVEQLTGSPRAGGLAVLVCATSAQWTDFNTQFAYQTLALPLALAAVAFIARARWAANPRPLLGGATVCLLALAGTHHLTSWITAVFLVLWTTAERGQARRRVFYGAVIAAVTTTVWAIIQWTLLQEYFGPLIGDYRSQFTGHQHRAAFHDSAGYVSPTWERALLVYYTAAMTLVVSLLILAYVRSVLPRLRSGASRCDARRWEPGVLLMVLITLNPLLMAVRVMPTCGEIGDRLSTFLALPLSLLVAGAADRWSQLRRGSNSPPWSHRQLVIIRSLALVLAAGVFAGGYLMGSGPDWNRLPGPYLASADARSMDAETLAAVRWARDGLPAGRLIGGDRVSSLLLSSQSGLWPVMHQGDLEVPSLYLADEWKPRQSKVARALHLRYLYVDRRLADDLPHVGSYFYRGETSEPQQLTQDELTKFDDVPGIRTVYRHGPISIYDLGGLYDPRGLNVPDFRYGWADPQTPDIGVRLQLAIGLLMGLALALVARSNAGYFVTEKVKSFRISAGPSLTFAAGLATLCVASITLLLAHIWLGPIIFLSMALAVLLVNPSWAKFPFRATFLLMNARLGWKRWIAASAMLAVVVAAIAQSILAAYREDVTKVQSILNDPAAVHIPDYDSAGSADGTR